MSERGPVSVPVGHGHSRGFEDLLKELESEALLKQAKRSLWLNQLVAAKIVQDPDWALSIARRNLQAMEADAPFENPWVKRWRLILQRGPEAAVAVLVSRHPEAVEMRQNTPFAGVLDSRERAKALEAFRRHWRSLHTKGRSRPPTKADESVAHGEA